MIKPIFSAVFLVFFLSGCVSMVVSTAVGVTTTVIGGAVDVVDAVTPDIIDDDDIYISTLEKMLDPVKDLITLCCVSSNFSLDRIAPFLSADLLILDLDLNSELFGHEILKYCREENFGNYICIHTNRISKHYIRKLSQEGADLVTPKPMSVIHLTNICAAAAEHSV